ncbi:hypothetical protein AnigIFM60653_010989 [Aspergillus niger]|nr:hypothetical protein AnigIFM60653_010989 [Aspergillus niger]
MQKKRKAPASQHVEKQPKKPCRQQNPAVPDAGNIDQEWIQAFLQTVKGSSIHYWIQNDRWPKTLFNNVLGSEPPEEEYEDDNEEEDEDSYKNRTEAYIDNIFVTYLWCQGSYLKNYRSGITEDEIKMCQELLKRECETPKDTLMDSNAWFHICKNIAQKNKSAIIRSIAQLIVPSAELEICRGQVSKAIDLVESINELWDHSIPLQWNPRLIQRRLPTPRPDYAVGFSKDAFTDEQYAKLEPLLGECGEASYYKGTQSMLFPFFVAEIRDASGSFLVAERQNAHSMTRALRGIVELYRLSGRCQDELDRKILGFSICYSHSHAELYAHYIVTKDKTETCYYRHFLETFNFVGGGMEERWKSYKFVMALYNDWVQIHHQRLCSAIDSLPDVDPHTTWTSELPALINGTVSENMTAAIYSGED